jgi:hypothetical protein
MGEGARKALTPDQLDNLGLALIEMAKEMWVMRDRQMVMEAMLREKGLLADVDTYQPGPELTARIAAERDRFLRDFTGVLFDNGDG